MPPPVHVSMHPRYVPALACPWFQIHRPISKHCDQGLLGNEVTKSILAQVPCDTLPFPFRNGTYLLLEQGCSRSAFDARSSFVLSFVDAQSSFVLSFGERTHSFGEETVQVLLQVSVLRAALLALEHCTPLLLRIGEVLLRFGVRVASI